MDCDFSITLYVCMQSFALWSLQAGELCDNPVRSAWELLSFVLFLNDDALLPDMFHLVHTADGKVIYLFSTCAAMALAALSFCHEISWSSNGYQVFGIVDSS